KSSGVQMFPIVAQMHGLCVTGTRSASRGSGKYEPTRCLYTYGDDLREHLGLDVSVLYLLVLIVSEHDLVE
ncbi:hypothetical protein PFISCL1PPCAC_12659, partial [Pristionchus fissidentatus]